MAPPSAQSRLFATPKSRSLGSPSGVTRMFDGLRSRWTMRRMWAAWTASHTATKSRMRSRRSRRRASHHCRRSSPWTYSMAMYGSPSSVTPPSMRRAIPGCSREARIRRSSSKRRTSRGSRKRVRITLRATVCSKPSASRMARKTSPIPPSPRGRTMRKFRIRSGCRPWKRHSSHRDGRPPVASWASRRERTSSISGGSSASRSRRHASRSPGGRSRTSSKTSSTRVQRSGVRVSGFTHAAPGSARPGPSSSPSEPSRSTLPALRRSRRWTSRRRTGTPRPGPVGH